MYIIIYYHSQCKIKLATVNSDTRLMSKDYPVVLSLLQIRLELNKVKNDRSRRRSALFQFFLYTSYWAKAHIFIRKITQHTTKQKCCENILQYNNDLISTQNWTLCKIWVCVNGNKWIHSHQVGIHFIYLLLESIAEHRILISFHASVTPSLSRAFVELFSTSSPPRLASPQNLPKPSPLTCLILFSVVPDHSTG